MLIIDAREHKLIELIKSIPKFNIQYVIQQLQIGDIIIQYKMPTGKPNNKINKTNNTDIINYTFNIIIERKYITDMIASVKDGRYKEQKIRLTAECVKPNIDILTNEISITNDITNIIHCKLACYIIEGLQSNLRMQQEKTILNGSIISSLFRDKLPILRTNTLQETLDIIIRLHDRLVFDYTDFFTILKPITMPVPIQISSITNDITIINDIITTTNIPIQDTNQEIINNNNNVKLAENMYLQSIKKCKKDNMTPQLWVQMCYMNIPGISNIIAIKIAEHYPTIKLLLLAYEKCSNETEKDLLLANIVLDNTETSTINTTIITTNKHHKNNRHIGNVISKRVKEYVNM